MAAVAWALPPSREVVWAPAIMDDAGPGAGKVFLIDDDGALVVDDGLYLVEAQ